MLTLTFNTNTASFANTDKLEIIIDPAKSTVPTSINNVGFTVSTSINSTANLASSATFTSSIEALLDKTLFGLSVFADQPLTITILQYVDAGGTQLVSTDTFTRLANVGFNEWVGLPGLYLKVTVQNTGASATTSINING